MHLTFFYCRYIIITKIGVNTYFYVIGAHYGDQTRNLPEQTDPKREKRVD